MNYLDNLKQISSNENIYIYGAGSFGKIFFNSIKHYRNDIKVINFIDIHAKGDLYGVKILSPSSLGHLASHRIIVCTRMAYWDDIRDNINDKPVLFNRFHDFNVYIRDCSKIHNKYTILKNLFYRCPDQIDTMLKCIRDRNIAPLINNSQVVQPLKNFINNSKLISGDVIINGGGSNGNENDSFVNILGINGQIYTFDPFHKEKSKKQNINNFKYLLYKNSGKVKFHYEGSRSRIIENGGVDIDCISIDDFVSKNKIGKLDFITLDTEGAEKDILMGAIKTIQRFKPKLAICLYHSTADFFEIPILINKINDKYELNLGVYNSQGLDTYIHAHIEKD